MELLPKELFKQVPRLYEQENVEDPIVHIKYFTPDANWYWLTTEVDEDGDVMFGLVYGFEKEWGYYSLTELKQVRGALGLPVERDLYYEPRPVSEVSREIESRRR